MRNLAIVLLLVFSFNLCSSADLGNAEEQGYLEIAGSDGLVLYCERYMETEEEFIAPAKARLAEEICDEAIIVKVKNCSWRWTTSAKNDCLREHDISAVKYIGLWNWMFSW